MPDICSENEIADKPVDIVGPCTIIAAVIAMVWLNGGHKNAVTYAITIEIMYTIPML
jgi:hypothetical protein